MYDPEYFRSILAPAIPWQEAYPRFATAVRDRLEFVAGDSAWGTTELVNNLFPLDAIDRDADHEVRKRMFRGLNAMIARDLKDWNRAGEPKKLKGRMIVPRLWANYGPTQAIPKTCPHCGGVL